MQVFADIFLGAGALGAGFYCLILARRLNRFNSLEKGVGGAVAVLSSQVDDLTRTLGAARDVSRGSTRTLEELTGRAEEVAARLELMMAALHDLPDPKEQAPADTAPDPDPTVAEPMFVRHARTGRRLS